MEEEERGLVGVIESLRGSFFFSGRGLRIFIFLKVGLEEGAET